MKEALRIDSRFNELRSEISSLRYNNDLAGAVALCSRGEEEFPDVPLFSMIKGDLYFQQQNYALAAKSYLLQLKKLSPASAAFKSFARRYFRLKTVLSPKDISDFASDIISELKKGDINKITAGQARQLVLPDLALATQEVELSSPGEEFQSLLNDDKNFNQAANLARQLEQNNPLELDLILRRNVIGRKRRIKHYRIDAHFIAYFERIKKYEMALKISQELLEIKFESTIVRSIFRICRLMGDYRQADQVLLRHPRIIKLNDFNILYELVYYFEAKDEKKDLLNILTRMERAAPENIPIHKTLRNFFFRFAMFDEAARIDAKILKLARERKRVSTEKFEFEVKESEEGKISRFQEAFSALEHQKQLEAISNLTTGISHELGQPITNIRYTLQFYRRRFSTKPEHEAVLIVFDSVLEETERMGALIQRLSPLTSSRSQVEEFDIIDRIKKRLNAETARLTKERTKVKVECQERCPIMLNWDPIKFDQIVSNLLLNSIDAIRERKGGPRKITIGARDLDHEIQIEFTDTGKGMPWEFRKKIFDPFFTTKDPGKGEGLGLFIVWNLLKSRGGAISLDYKYDNGARFLIRIPKHFGPPKEG